MSPGRKPRYRMHDGFRMPLGFPVEGLDSGMGYRPAEGDIFVCTYPKCGTTWVQYIVWLLVRQRPIGPDESLTELFPHLEEVGAEAIAAMAEPRLIKTHLPLDMTPFDAAGRYVVTARNPFDCAVSFYHHTRGFPRHYDFADGDFDTFFECFLAGEVDFGDYFDHLVPWVEAASDSNVLLLTYEGLKRDTVAGIRQLAGFLGENTERAAADDAFLDWIIGESGIRSMRRNQQRWSSERPADLPFIRKGIVGDWCDMFSSPQARALAAKFDDRTKGTAAAALWPEILAAARRH